MSEDKIFSTERQGRRIFELLEQGRMQEGIHAIGELVLVVGEYDDNLKPSPDLEKIKNIYFELLDNQLFFKKEVVKEILFNLSLFWHAFDFKFKSEFINKIKSLIGKPQVQDSFFLLSQILGEKEPEGLGFDTLVEMSALGKGFVKYANHGFIHLAEVTPNDEIAKKAMNQVSLNDMRYGEERVT